MNPMAGMMNNMAQNVVKNAVGNNPLFAVLNALKNGNNPMALMQSIAQKDPRMAQALKMIQGKSPSELQQIATNLCAERGTTPAEVAQSLGFNLPQGK